MMREPKPANVVEETREILDLATLLIGKASTLLELHHLTIATSADDALRSDAARQSGALVPFPLPPPPVMGYRKRCRSSLDTASVRCAHARFIAWQRFHGPRLRLVA